MRVSYSFKERSIAWVLLVSFFLQNCANFGISPIEPVLDQTDVKETQQVSQISRAEDLEAITMESIVSSAKDQEETTSKDNLPSIEIEPSIALKETNQDTALQEKIFLTADNYQVQFLKQPKGWKAQVRGSWSGDMGKWRSVPVYLDSDRLLTDLLAYEPLLQKRRMHLLFDQTIKHHKVPIGVHVGELGLKGGEESRLLQVIRAGNIAEAMRLLDQVSLGERKNVPSSSLWMAGLSNLAYNLTQMISIVNIRDEAGVFPLHRAVCCKIIDEAVVLWLSRPTYTHNALIDKLIEKGAHINAKDNRGQTPLHWALRHMQGNGKAVAKGDPDYPSIIRELVALKADINAQDERGYTPLHYAVESKNPYAIALLVELGVDKSAQDNKRDTPLHLAINLGYTEIAKQLIDSGVFLWQSGSGANVPVHCALLKQNRMLVEYLVKKGASFYLKNDAGFTPIEFAAQQGNLAYIAQIFASNLRELNNISHQDGLTHLQRAIQKKDVDLAKALLGAGIDVNLQEQLKSSPEIGWFDGPRVNHRTALHMAIEQENIELIKYLVEKGASKEIEDKEGKTAIDYVLDKAGSPHFEALVKALKIDLRDPNGQGGKWLGQAIHEGKIAWVRGLITSGVNIHLVTPDGNSPLHVAVELGRLDMAKELSALGANPKMKNKQGITPIHEV